MGPRPKVVYILGGTRSGTTMLDLLLGQLPGYVSTGELRRIWERGILQGRRCGCGRPLPACSLWSSVLQRIHGTADLHEVAKNVLLTQRAVLRTRHTPGLLFRACEAVATSAVSSYGTLLTRLYAAIAEATGAMVVVDSSKLPSDAALLGRLPDVNVRFVHLVRDPRAVAWSWQRRQPEPDHPAGVEMPRHGLLWTAVNWVAPNLGAELIRMRCDRTVRMRYEDFARSPAEALACITTFVGEPRSVGWLRDGTAELNPTHTVGGNPVRFTKDHIDIRPDDEWKTRLPGRDWWLVTALASPLLRRYGYPIRR